MSQQHALPVTVSVTRHVDPSRSTEMLAWVQAGTSMAEKFEGFLGSGWVRPSEDSAEWHMLYRFADAESLAAWEASAQRAWWLEAAQGGIEATRVEKRTGIEGWFDEPASSAVHEPCPATPPRWKQASVIWVAFFPTSLALTYLLSPFSAGWPVVLRVLVTTVLATPWMTYVLLPFVTRLFGRWLKGS